MPPPVGAGRVVPTGPPMPVDELGAGVVIAGDFAGGAGSVAAGGADGLGDGGVPSAAATPSITPVMAVVTKSFFNIRDPPDSNWNFGIPPVLGPTGGGLRGS